MYLFTNFMVILMYIYLGGVRVKVYKNYHIFKITNLFLHYKYTKMTQKQLTIWALNYNPRIILVYFHIVVYKKIV